MIIIIREPAYLIRHNISMGIVNCDFMSVVFLYVFSAIVQNHFICEPVRHLESPCTIGSYLCVHMNMAAHHDYY